MAVLKIFSILLLVHSITCNSNEPSPLMNCAKIVNYTGDEVTLQNISKVLLPLHHVERRSIDHGSNDLGLGSGLEQTEDLLRLAALVPAETLQLLRMVAVPLLNTSLAVPAAVLEKASNVSFSDFRPANWTGSSSTGWGDVRHYVAIPSHDYHNFSFPHFNFTGDSKYMHQTFLTPMATFLSMSANTTKKAIPVALDAEHLRRHYDNFRRFLGARDYSVEPTPVNSSEPTAVTPSEPTTGNSIESTTKKPQA